MLAPRNAHTAGTGTGMGDLATSYDEMAAQMKAWVGDVDLGTVAMYGGGLVAAWFVLSAVVQGGRTRGRR